MSLRISRIARVSSGVLGLLVLVTLPSSLAGQEEAPVATAGDRVRATLIAEPGSRVPLAKRRVVGTLVDRRDGLLFIRPTDDSLTLQLPVSKVERLEVRACCGRGGGFLKGAAVGAGVAIAAGLALRSVDSGNDPSMAVEAAVYIGLPIGALVGGLIGRELSSSPRWVRSRIP